MTTLLAAWALWRTPSAAPASNTPVTRLAIVPPGDTLRTNNSGSAISPDGRALAFVSLGTAAQAGETLLFIRPLDSLEARAIPGSESAQRPFWSPDSKTVAFFKGGQLLRADLAGGGVQTICATSGAGRGGTWNAEGIILFADQNNQVGIKRVAAGGGQPTPITELDAARGEDSHYYPQFLPDGQHFLYFRRARTATAAQGAYVGTLGDAQKGKADKLVLAGATRPVFTGTHLLYLQDESLMAQRFDPATYTVSGAPTPIATGVYQVPANNWFDVSASNEGLVAYGTGHNELLMRWKDRTGKVLGSATEPISEGNFRISPDGRQVLGYWTSKERQGNWILDVERGTRTRVTFEQTNGNSGVWSPNSTEIAYRDSARGVAIRIKAANGAGEAREIKLEGKVGRTITDWTRDGRIIVSMDGNIFSVPAAGGAGLLKLQPLIAAGPGARGNGRVSPDGQWLAYNSDESGQQEVYIAGIGAAKGKWQVSSNGGSTPRWRADGRELAYVASASGNRNLTVVPVEASVAGIRLGQPQPLFAVPFNFDLTADHQRILVSEPPEGRQNSPFVILQGWQQLVK